ncbi:hypothetical protein AB0L00_36600 [Actinoallomurus sp. NPDC052308]|uniref:hypothetical protein n=1 Tax=Actinoallomurus sp. NPDC052308 TaxID=3155530 RepID=UPI00341C296A
MSIDFSKRPAATLTKNDDAVGVALDDKVGGVITAELTWRSGVEGGSDLDLFGWVIGRNDVVVPTPSKGLRGLMAKATTPLPANAATVVYHHNLGSLQAPPFMRHGGDSRTPGREVMYLAGLEKQGYALFGVYQAYGNGAGSLLRFGATVTVTDTEGNKVTVPLLQDHPNRYWATIVLVDCTDPRGYVIRQVEQYSRPGTEHSPVLYADGSFKMNQGPTYLVK